MAQYLIPGGPYVDEDVDADAQIPGFQFIILEGGGGGSFAEADLAIAVTGVAQWSASSRAQSELSVSASGVAQFSSSALSFTDTALGVSAVGSVQWISPPVAVSSAQYLIPGGPYIDDDVTIEVLIPRYQFINLQGSSQEPERISLDIAATSDAQWTGSSEVNSGARFSASAGSIWTGFEISVISGVSIVATSSMSMGGGFGSIFYIRDDQTEMSPTGASVANSSLVVSAAGIANWNGLQASALAFFDIPASASSTFSAEATSASSFGISGTSTLTFAEESTEQPAAIIAAAALVQWNTLDTVFGTAELGAHSRGQLDFGSIGIGPTPSAFNIPRTSLLSWRSTKDVDDDDETDDRRTIWAGAAEAEREAALARRIYDEEEFALFSAALAGACAQYMKELQ